MTRSEQMDSAPDSQAAQPALAWALPAELSIIVPTFNEARNVPLLVEAVAQALPGVRWELVFVDDDSPDGTADRARTLAQADPRVRIIHRFGRRGLASACIEGMLATASPYVAVMDGDMQHDETAPATMPAGLGQGDVVMVVGNRYVEAGRNGAWNKRRIAMIGIQDPAVPTQIKASNDQPKRDSIL